MWKKKDVSQMYVLDTHSLDIRHLKPNQWTCVFLWNSNGNMPANPEVPHQQQPIDPPPGLPPVDNQPPVDPYGDVPMPRESKHLLWTSFLLMTALAVVC